MKIYDISQEVFGCSVYPGDESPKMNDLMRTERGEPYNLTSFSMCAHNGTHIDAPFHFLSSGATVENVSLEKTVGVCYVTEFRGRVGEAEAKTMLSDAKSASADSAKRLLIKGEAIVTSEAAKVFAAEGIYLIGVESQSVGEGDVQIAVHKILLSAEVVLLEGIRLSAISEGVYFLCAAPLCLGGSDGAPCRALLIEDIEKGLSH